jgi:hypothetical protein
MGKKQTESGGDGDNWDKGVKVQMCKVAFFFIRILNRTDGPFPPSSFCRFWPGTANKSFFLEGLSESLFLRGGRQQVIWGLLKSKSQYYIYICIIEQDTTRMQYRA